MVKKRKVKSSGTRSASAANRISKTHKEVFVKRPSIAVPENEERKQGLGVLKFFVLAIFVLIVGATVLAKYTGADKVGRGDKKQDAACTATEECDNGMVCYQYTTHPDSCKKLCKSDDDCSSEHTCTSVVRFGKKRVKPMKVCVNNSELEQPSR